MLKVNTLFPSPQDEEGRVKGGVIILKLQAKDGIDKLPTNPTLLVNVKYLFYGNIQRIILL